MTNKDIQKNITVMLIWFSTACGSLNGIINSNNDFMTYTLDIILVVSFYKVLMCYNGLYEIFSEPESKQGYPVFKVNNKYFIGLELPLGTTEKNFHDEIILLKGVYGHASSEASVRLDNHYKNHKSVLGLK